jgi:hypothetical protein
MGWLFNAQGIVFCEMHQQKNDGWKEHSVPGPILLANRDNVTTLQDLAEEPLDNANIETNAGVAMCITDVTPPTKVQQ